MTTPYSIILTTAGSKEEAGRIAALLLERRAAACVQQMPVASSYRWKGKIEKADEILLLIKTRFGLYREVEELIRSVHSYEIPEIVMLPIGGGLGAYLDWIGAETGRRAPSDG